MRFKAVSYKNVPNCNPTTKVRLVFVYDSFYEMILILSLVKYFVENWFRKFGFDAKFRRPLGMV